MRGEVMNKEKSDLISAEQNKSTEEILKAAAKFKSDYHKLCELKDMRIEQLEKDVKLLGERCNQLLADKGKLTDELDKWKAEWNEQVIKANEEGFERTKQTIQLSKAKELLEDMYYKIPASHSDYYKDVMERARQFLQECE